MSHSHDSESEFEKLSKVITEAVMTSEKVRRVVEEIQKKVAEHYNIKMSDMSSDKRTRSIARPRQIAMYLAKNLTNKSYIQDNK